MITGFEADAIIAVLDNSFIYKIGLLFIFILPILKPEVIRFGK